MYATGTPFLADSMRVRLNRGATAAAEDVYFKFVYQPMPDGGRSRRRHRGRRAPTSPTGQRAQRDAEAANRAKDEFLAMLGHELRNPLAPILTALQLMSLRDGADATERSAP